MAHVLLKDLVALLVFSPVEVVCDHLERLVVVPVPGDQEPVEEPVEVKTPMKILISF